MSDKIEVLLKETKAELERVGSEVKTVAENALKESAKAGELSAETKSTADKALAEFHGMTKTVANLQGKIEAMETANLDLAQIVADHGGRADQVQTLGQAMAGDEGLQNFAKLGANGSHTLKVENAITSASGSGGDLIAPDRENAVVALARRRLTIRQLLSTGTTVSNLVEYARQTTRTNNAGTVAENTARGESAYAWEKADAAVRTVSHVTHISKPALDDAGQLQALVDGEMRYGLDLEEENQILAGDGLGENLSGLITNATAFSAAAGLPDATRIDRLRLGLLQVALTDYSADGIVLNPTDWAGIELLKDTTGHYIYGNPHAASTPMLWGLDVVATQSVGVGEWLTGAFFMAATLYDRQVTEVLISSEHSDNFVKGMLTMRAEKRVALAVKRAAALVTGDFTFV